MSHQNSIKLRFCKFDRLPKMHLFHDLLSLNSLAVMIILCRAVYIISNTSHWPTDTAYLLQSAMDIPGLNLSQQEYYPYVYYKIDCNLLDFKV